MQIHDLLTKIIYISIATFDYTNSSTTKIQEYIVQKSKEPEEAQATNFKDAKLGQK